MGEAGAQRYVFAWSPKAQRSQAVARDSDNIGLYRILAYQASAKAAIARCNARADTVDNQLDDFCHFGAGFCLAGRPADHSPILCLRSALCICLPILKRTVQRFSIA